MGGAGHKLKVKTEKVSSLNSQQKTKKRIYWKLALENEGS